jgi:hypothetical protein
MAETFQAYRTRVLSYLGDEEPIGVQQATPSQLESRLRDVAPEDLIRRPAPEKWSIAEIVAHLADAELAMGWRLRNMNCVLGTNTCSLDAFTQSQARYALGRTQTKRNRFTRPFPIGDVDPKAAVRRRSWIPLAVLMTLIHIPLLSALL